MQEKNIAELMELLALGRDGGAHSLMIHGVGVGVMFDLMQDGRLTSLKRETRDFNAMPYLMGSVKIEDVDVTLFSEDLPMPDVLAAVEEEIPL